MTLNNVQYTNPSDICDIFAKFFQIVYANDNVHICFVWYKFYFMYLIEMLTYVFESLIISFLTSQLADFDQSAWFCARPFC